MLCPSFELFSRGAAYAAFSIQPLAQEKKDIQLLFFVLTVQAPGDWLV